MDCSPPGSSVHGIFQARVLEWVAIAFSHVLIASLVLINRQYFLPLLWMNLGEVKSCQVCQPSDEALCIQSADMPGKKVLISSLFFSLLAARNVFCFSVVCFSQSPKVALQELARCTVVFKIFVSTRRLMLFFSLFVPE